MLNNAAPPLYGAHRLDQLYNDVDVSGFMTPAGAPSGFNTPFVSHSRSTSTDNLVSTNAETPSGFAASILHNRLHGLGTVSSQRDRAHLPSASNEPLDAGGQGTARQGDVLQLAVDAPTLGGSPSHGSPISPTAQRESEEDFPASPTHLIPRHIELSTEALSRVPSYTTARHSRPPTLINYGLPNYQTALRDPIVPTIAPPTIAPPTTVSPTIAPPTIAPPTTASPTTVSPTIVPPTTGEAHPRVGHEDSAP